MANRHYSEFVEKKITEKAARKSASPKGSPTPKGGGERTAAWPDPGRHRASGFNRTTKFPVVKTHAAKAGVD